MLKFDHMLSKFDHMVSNFDHMLSKLVKQLKKPVFKYTFHDVPRCQIDHMKVWRLIV